MEALSSMIVSPLYFIHGEESHKIMSRIQDACIRLSTERERESVVQSFVVRRSEQSTYRESVHIFCADSRVEKRVTSSKVTLDLTQDMYVLLEEERLAVSRAQAVFKTLSTQRYLAPIKQCLKFNSSDYLFKGGFTAVGDAFDENILAQAAAVRREGMKA